MDDDDLTKTEQTVLDTLADGRATPAALADWGGVSISSVHNALRSLRAAERVEKVHDGLYELADDPRDGEVGNE